MLTIIVPSVEFFDESTQEFINGKETTLILEHSLVSMSKWESKFCKPFLGPDEKTKEEIIYYIQMMVIDGEFSELVYKSFNQKILDEINDYINSPQSATTFWESPQHKTMKRNEVITSELIYFWMFSYGVPKECEHWHLNRLFTLLRIFNVKNSKQKKMSKHELAARNRELNEQRKAQLGTKG